jgi:hypothetical protein
MPCRSLFFACLALLLVLALPARGEALYLDPSYPREAETPAVSEAGAIAFVSDADLVPRGTQTDEAPRRRSPGNADGGAELFLFRPTALWPFVQLTNDPAGSRKGHVAIGRDGRAIAWVESVGSEDYATYRLWLLPLGRRQPVFVMESQGILGATAVSDRLPAGYRLAVTEEIEGAARVQVVDVVFDPLPRAVPRLKFPGQDPSLSRSGTRLAYTNRDAEGRSQVRLWARDGGFSAITEGADDSARPRLSGDGTHVAFESRANLAILNRDGNREIFLFDTATRRITQITRTSESVENRSPRVNGNGTRVAFLSNGNLLGRNADGNEEVFLWMAGSPPRLRQVTDTRPEPVADPGPAPYPIGSLWLPPVHHEKVVDRRVGEDGVLVQIGMGGEDVFASFAVNKGFCPLEPAHVVDHGDHRARPV